MVELGAKKSDWEVKLDLALIMFKKLTNEHQHDKISHYEFVTTLIDSKNFSMGEPLRLISTLLERGHITPEPADKQPPTSAPYYKLSAASVAERSL